MIDATLLYCSICVLTRIPEDTYMERHDMGLYVFSYLPYRYECGVMCATNVLGQVGARIRDMSVCVTWAG